MENERSCPTSGTWGYFPLVLSVPLRDRALNDWVLTTEENVMPVGSAPGIGGQTGGRKSEAEAQRRQGTSFAAQR